MKLRPFDLICGSPVLSDPNSASVIILPVPHRTKAYSPFKGYASGYRGFDWVGRGSTAVSNFAMDGLGLRQLKSEFIEKFQKVTRPMVKKFMR